MIAKFEKNISYVSGQTWVCKYKNLHNLLHWHTEHEIIYVLSGCAEININNKTIILSEDMCTFVKGGDIHYISGDTESIVCVVKSDAPSLARIIRNKELCSPVISKTENIKKYIEEISNESKKSSEYSAIIANCIATRMIAEIFRSEDVCNTKQQFKQNDKSINLLSLITADFEHITFDDAANFMNFSKSYFSKYFQELTGIKFTQYLNILKVASAVEKLKDQNRTVTEISLTCGFETIRNFNRVFKKITGYSPKSLPEDYVFPYTVLSSDNTGFDPTLNCSVVLK